MTFYNDIYEHSEIPYIEVILYLHQNAPHLLHRFLFMYKKIQISYVEILIYFNKIQISYVEGFFYIKKIPDLLRGGFVFT